MVHQGLENFSLWRKDSISLIKISNYFELESIVFPPVTICPLYNENVDEASRLSGNIKNCKKDFDTFHFTEEDCKRNFKWPSIQRDVNSRITTLPWKPFFYNNNMENIVVFLCVKVFNSDNSLMHFCIRKVQVTYVLKPQLKIISFQIYKHWYLIHEWWDKALMGTVVNRHCHLFMEWSLEIMLTVPLTYLSVPLKKLS